MPFLKISYNEVPAIQEVEIPVDVHAQLDAFYQLIPCNTISVVNTVLPRLVMIVDDVGKLSDDWETRINGLASALYGNPYDVIAGNVIIGRLEAPDIVPLTRADIDRVFAYFDI